MGRVEMDLRKMYETDADFKGYVDRFVKHRNISTDEALKHSIVRNYAEDLEERKKDGQID